MLVTIVLLSLGLCQQPAAMDTAPIGRLIATGSERAIALLTERAPASWVMSGGEDVDPVAQCAPEYTDRTDKQ